MRLVERGAIMEGGADIHDAAAAPRLEVRVCCSAHLERSQRVDLHHCAAAVSQRRPHASSSCPLQVSFACPLCVNTLSIYITAVLAPSYPRNTCQDQLYESEW